MPSVPSADTNPTRGYTIALCSAAVLSTTAVFIRYLSVSFQLPSLVLACWRDAIAAATVWLYLLIVGRRDQLAVTREQLRYLLMYGLVLAGFNALWTVSVANNGAAVATVLVYSSAAFTALLGRLLLHERLSTAKLLVIALTLGGCALISGAVSATAWSGHWGGILLGLLSGLGYAAYSLLGRSAAQRGLNPWTTLFYTFAFATFALLAANLLPGNLVPGTINRWQDFFWLRDAWAGWGALALLAAGPTVLGFGLYNVSLTYLPSHVANLLATTEPTFTAIIAYLLLGEQLTTLQAIGGLMIVSGVAVLHLKEKRNGKIRCCQALTPTGKPY